MSKKTFSFIFHSHQNQKECFFEIFQSEMGCHKLLLPQPQISEEAEKTFQSDTLAVSPKSSMAKEKKVLQLWLQSAVRAASEGRILVLEGIEKVGFYQILTGVLSVLIILKNITISNILTARCLIMRGNKVFQVRFLDLRYQCTIIIIFVS